MMRVRSLHTPRREWGGTMTPMIDVIFLLLIFFICTASFQPLEEELPATLAGEVETPDGPPPPPEQHEPPVVVRITLEKGVLQFRVDETPCATLDVVRVALASHPHDAETIIAPARDIAVRDALAVYDLCRALHRTEIRFGVSKEMGGAAVNPPGRVLRQTGYQRDPESP